MKAIKLMPNLTEKKNESENITTVFHSNIYKVVGKFCDNALKYANMC